VRIIGVMQAHSIATVVTLSAFLTETSRQAGLVVTVQVGEDEYQQTIGVPVQDGVEGPATVDMKFRQPAEVPTTMPR
jgi:hypothetical protein